MGYPPRFADELGRAVAGGLDLPALTASLSVAIAGLAAEPRLGAGGRLVLTGSGDSLFAARAMLPALRRWSGRPVEALGALDFARYEASLLGPADVVLGVSNSGNSSRTRESMLLARDRGSLTVAVTGSRTGALAALAAHVLHRPVCPVDVGEPAYGRVYLNLVEYVATLFALSQVGLELGRWAGRLTAGDRARDLAECEAAVAAIAGTARAAEPAAEALAAELVGLDTIWAIGAGPSRGTADYVAAKFHEQLPVNGIGQDLEEWAHCQYFLTLAWGARAVVLVLAPPGNALDRAEELVDGIAGAGGRAVVVAHPAHGRFPKAHARLDVPCDVPEGLTPIVYHVPAQLLVLHLARMMNVPLTPLRRRDDYGLIRKGAVRETAAGLA